MKIYACAIMAQRFTKNGRDVKQDINSCALVVGADNERDARNFAIKQAQDNVYPVRQGWRNHTVSSAETPRWMIDEASKTK